MIDDMLLSEIFLKMKTEKITALEILQKNLISGIEGYTIKEIRHALRKKYKKEFMNFVRKILKERKK